MNRLVVHCEKSLDEWPAKQLVGHNFISRSLQSLERSLQARRDSSDPSDWLRLTRDGFFETVWLTSAVASTGEDRFSLKRTLLFIT